MAILCLGGFVPSFFLRPRFFDDPLPVWMHFHGVLFTLWYFVAILQSWLILKNKRALHRELGVVSAFIVISAFILTYVAVAYLTATGRHVTGGARFNIILTSAFTCCVAVGVYFRRKPEIHKRLMIMAGALLTVPGFDRLIRNIFQPSFPTLTTKNAQMIVLFFAVVFVGFMIYRDFRQFKRPSLGVALGFVCFFVGGTFGSMFVSTEIWTAMVASFASSATAGTHIPH
jgi:FtsH-binding integral membrane protein